MRKALFPAYHVRCVQVHMRRGLFLKSPLTLALKMATQSLHMTSCLVLADQSTKFGGKELSGSEDKGAADVDIQGFKPCRWLWHLRQQSKRSVQNSALWWTTATSSSLARRSAGRKISNKVISGGTHERKKQKHTTSTRETVQLFTPC